MASKHQSKLIKEYEKKGYLVILLKKTNHNGMTDLLCLKPDEPAIFIEIKEVKDTLKPLQKYWINKLNKMGFTAFKSQATQLPTSILSK